MKKFWSPFGSVWLKYSGDGSILGPDRLLFQVFQASFTSTLWTHPSLDAPFSFCLRFLIGPHSDAVGLTSPPVVLECNYTYFPVGRAVSSNGKWADCHVYCVVYLLALCKLCPTCFFFFLFSFTGSLWSKYFLIYEVKALNLVINWLGEFFMKKKLVYWKTVRAHVGKIITRQEIYFQFLPISFSQSLSTCVCAYGTRCAVRLSVWAARTKWKWAASGPADTEALDFCCMLSGQWEDDICVGFEPVKTLPCHFLSFDSPKPEQGNKVGESRREKWLLLFFLKSFVLWDLDPMAWASVWVNLPDGMFHTSTWEVPTEKMFV